MSNALVNALCFKNKSCYNAFSRMDVRVEVKIPGGVESYCIDTHGERYVSIRMFGRVSSFFSS